MAHAPKSLGDLQFAILKVLWTEGPASTAAVHRALLEQRGLAPTTIATMLRKMEARGLVGHTREGRQFLWRAAVEEPEVQRGMVGALVERLFGGDSKALVNHLLREGEIEPEELDGLRRRVADEERRS